MINRREASKQETRQLILRAARRLFAQKGMEDCTIRDIAREAGVSPASVVVHFQSKTALLEAALKADIDKTLSGLLASLPQDRPLLDRLMHLAKGFFGLYDQNRDLYRALIRTTVFEPRGTTPSLANLTDRYIQLLVSMVEEEQNQGNLKPDVDPMAAAGSFFSLYIGALIMFFRTPEMPVQQALEILAAMTAQSLQGIFR